MTDEKNWSFPPFFCKNIYTLRNEGWWANFAGKTSRQVQAFKSLFYIDALHGTEGRYELVFIHAACLILLPCVATLFAPRVLGPLHYSYPFPLFRPSCRCQRSSLRALPGTVRWAAAVKGEQWKNQWWQPLLPNPCCATAAWVSGLWWQSLSPGLASQAVSSRELAGRSILWALVQVLCRQLASTVPV